MSLHLLTAFGRLFLWNLAFELWIGWLHVLRCVFPYLKHPKVISCFLPCTDLQTHVQMSTSYLMTSIELSPKHLNFILVQHCLAWCMVLFPSQPLLCLPFSHQYLPFPSYPSPSPCFSSALLLCTSLYPFSSHHHYCSGVFISLSMPSVNLSSKLWPERELLRHMSDHSTFWG